MTVDQLADWALRVIMAFIAVFTVLWGRSQKQSDDLVQSKAEDLKRIVDHDRRNMETLVLAKAAALEQSVNDKARALDRLFESQLAARDQRMHALEKQLDEASDRASTAASRLTGKMGDVDHRLTVLETQMAAR